jgi:uncharacterized lipoprotein YehR (DUF1307 family)
MSKNNYFIKALIIILIFTLSFTVCSCGKEEKGTYINGTYMNDRLNVGYIFYPDGKGYQFISKDHFLIEYEISDSMITITTILDGSDITKTFPFEQSGDDIIIDGVTYTFVDDSTSGVPDDISGLN